MVVPTDKWRTAMNTKDNARFHELSSKELDAVAGGERAVTAAEVKAAVDHGAGLAPLDLAAWQRDVLKNCR